MKIVKKLSVFIVLILLSFYSCENTELDLLENPNTITESSSDPDFLLNNIQVRTAGFFSAMQGHTTDVVRMRSMFGTYQNAVAANGLDGTWDNFYDNILNDGKVLKELALSRGLNHHIGVAQVLESYATMMAVDYWGSIPFEEASLGSENLNPAITSDEVIYDTVLANLDEAITNLNSTVAVSVTSDFYYGGNMDQWVKLANTLKIRAYLNLRLVRDVTADVDAIVNTGDFISSSADDFQFTYTSQVANPDSRHPFYAGNYEAGGAAGYMGNYLMYIMKDEKSVTDPRLRYYFYRQTNNDPTGDDLPCAGNVNYDYCYIGDGYWGRDHGDNEGLPADTDMRTTFGVYPGGGEFDADFFETAEDRNAEASSFPSMAKGAGIQPMMLSSFTYFMLAELALTEGVTGDAGIYFDMAVRASMDKVLNFNASTTVNPDRENTNGDSFEDFIPTQVMVDSYYTLVNSLYTAGSDAEKLNLINKEYYIALFGNAVEVYTMFKRNGPILRLENDPLGDLQDGVVPVGDFPRLLFLPEDAVAANLNLNQQSITGQVFWDNNPAGFID